MGVWRELSGSLRGEKMRGAGRGVLTIKERDPRIEMSSMGGGGLPDSYRVKSTPSVYELIGGEEVI